MICAMITYIDVAKRKQKLCNAMTSHTGGGCFEYMVLVFIPNTNRSTISAGMMYTIHTTLAMVSMCDPCFFCSGFIMGYSVTFNSHSLYFSSSPRTIRKKRSCNIPVILPRVPSPMVRLSMARIQAI